MADPGPEGPDAPELTDAQPSAVLGHAALDDLLARRGPEPVLAGGIAPGPYRVPASALAAAAVVAVLSVSAFAMASPAREPSSNPTTTEPPAHLAIVAPSLPPTTTTSVEPSAVPAATGAAEGPGASAPVNAASPRIPGTPGACTLADLGITVTTDAASYTPGQAVTIPTTAVVRSACIFTPTAPPGGPCPVAVSVVDVDPGAGARQAWPAPGDQPECRTFASALAQPGTAYTVTFTWDQATAAGPCCISGPAPSRSRPRGRGTSVASGRRPRRPWCRRPLRSASAPARRRAAQARTDAATSSSR